jgi:2-isopropylmalate synthase
LNAQTNINTKKIVPTSRLVSNLMRMPVQANKAIVGRNAFAHSSGIHQDGVLKHRTTYETINPQDVGLEPTIVLTARSGRAALKHHLVRLGYKLTPEKLTTIYKEFLVLADKKKDITDEDLQLLMGDLANGKRVKLSLLQVVCGTPLEPMATVKLTVDGKVETATSTGNGPIDSAYHAIDNILKKKVVLEEYLVQALTKGSDDRGKVHVQIAYKGVLYFGFGADHDIVVASVKAYLDGLNKIV